MIQSGGTQKLTGFVFAVPPHTPTYGIIATTSSRIVSIPTLSTNLAVLSCGFA
jgi:hypothetical protein